MVQKYFSMIAGFFLAGCQGAFRDADMIKQMLPGTYVNQSMGGYAIAFDTLVISKPADNSDVFLIDRKVSFQKIRHNQLQTTEHQLEHWTALYDINTRILTGTRKGRQLLYIPEKKLLFVNRTAYKKIKS